MSVAATKFQKGEERYILRSQIKEAPYNPRIIGEGAEKCLRAFIKKHGLFGTIIWNERTGNIVSGHQRLKALDYNGKYPEAGDYQLRITVVDLTDWEEKQANVFLNNPDAQGDWDVGMLGNLMQADEFTAEELGFTESTAVMMVDGDPRFSALFQDTEDVTATKEQILEVRDHRADSMMDMQEAQSADFYFTVVFQNQKAKDRFLMEMGVPVCEQFVNGDILSRRFGVDSGE